MTREELDSLKEGDIVIEDDGQEWCIVQVIEAEDNLVTYTLLDTTELGYEPGLVVTAERDKFADSNIRLNTTLVSTSVLCECGAERCGYGSHSTWCPKARQI